MKSIQCGCDFCNDMRYIEPAGFISLVDDEEAEQFFKDAHKRKKFVLETEEAFYEVDECPRCGYKFTEEDYDSYFND